MALLQVVIDEVLQEELVHIGLATNSCGATNRKRPSLGPMSAPSNVSATRNFGIEEYRIKFGKSEHYSIAVFCFRYSLGSHERLSSSSNTPS